MAQTVKNLVECGRPGFDPWVRKIPWRRKQQPTPIFLSGEFHGQRSLVDYSPWGSQRVGHTEWLTQTYISWNIWACQVGTVSKKPAANAVCGRLGFNPCVGKIPWRRKWQLTPVFLPGKSHGQRNLVGYSSWGHKESDMTERLNWTELNQMRLKLDGT